MSAIVAVVALFVPAVYIVSSTAPEPARPPTVEVAPQKPSAASEPSAAGPSDQPSPSTTADRETPARDPELALAPDSNSPAREPATGQPDAPPALEASPETASPPPTTPLQAFPGDGGASEAPAAPSAAASCVVVDSNIVESIDVTVGMRLCSADQNNVAVIKGIKEKTVIYAVNADPDVRCRVGELCGFNWRGGPIFRVLVTADADGQFSASLVSRN